MASSLSGITKDTSQEQKDATRFRWHKHYDAGVPHSMDYPIAALYTLLDQAADNSPRDLACVFHNYKITYAGMRQKAEIMAANLRRHGLQPGDRVIVMLPNLPQTMIALWGVLKAGGIGVMSNPLYMEKEILHQARDSGATFLITIDALWAKVNNLRPQLDIRKYFVTSIAESLKFPLNLLYRLKGLREKSSPKVRFDNDSVFPFASLLKGNARLSHPIADPKNTVALLQYSGGTTGVPKGVMLTHHNLIANVCQAVHFLRLTKGDHKFLAVLPFFHVYGLTTCLLLPAVVSATVYPLPRYMPQDVLQSITQNKINILPGAPSVYISLLQQKNITKYDLSHVTHCISGSAPMPVEYIRRFHEQVGGALVEGYGLTEASPITHLNPMGNSRKPGTIGMPLPDTEARIVDMDLGTLELPPGKVGELIVRGPQIMAGYWNNPDETANAVRNGWLYTGDIASMDEDGYFQIVDRKKDMIIVGGYNVYPREIDEVLHEHPKVREAVTVGISHPTRGETIKAYIVPKDGVTLDKTEIVAHCRAKLANFKIPRQIEFRKELPKTMVGKILRRTLRNEEEEKFSRLSEQELINDSEKHDV